MRLFIALELSRNAKNKLFEIQNGIKKSCLSGNFSSCDNFHITLAFIGEAPPSDVMPLKRLIASTDGFYPQYCISLDRAGVFHRDGGDILWFGAKLPGELYAYRENLANSLRRNGYDIDNRFTPHITLAREVVFKPGFDCSRFFANYPDTAEVRLFKSERIRGVLTYTAL